MTFCMLLERTNIVSLCESIFNEEYYDNKDEEAVEAMKYFNSVGYT